MKITFAIWRTDRVSGVRVTVTFHTNLCYQPFPQTIQVATDTNGAYNVTNLPPGEVTVTFTNWLVTYRRSQMSAAMTPSTVMAR
jgi:hypothetical protein